MKRILIVLASIAAFVLPMLAFAPAASAATGVVTNGMGWTGSLTSDAVESRCTLAAVGYDMHGNKIAISAAHCVSQGPGQVPGLPYSNGNYVPDGGPVYEWTSNNGPRKHIGNIAYRSWNGTGYPVPVDQVNPATSFGTDYVVIKLNADADIRSQGPAARIDGIGVANPGLFTNMCKDGIGSGITCGIVVGDSPTRIYTLGSSTGGDSGGPLMVAGTTKISGYVKGFTTSFEYVKFSAVLNEINSPGSPFPEGKGFNPVNN
ncbi:hypothetical protein AB4Z09_18175 [Rhodococcus sp. TAF43]|uniref:hypothetical protein n=1 Tax=Rhodococcus sp. TAF43 TaxID=3237483 RepID=UPI003F99EFF6